ncbi:MAG: chemotaxis protein CheW [Oscillatoriaceae cyanobacterium]
MLMLLFYIGKERYCVGAERVVEIIPMVALRQVAQAPEWVAGLLNYRGTIIPAIDLCCLLQKRPCSAALSTRMIVVNYWDEVNSSEQLFALIAERVTETLSREATTDVSTAMSLDNPPYLGEMITDVQGMIQMLRVEELWGVYRGKYLLPKGE